MEIWVVWLVIAAVLMIAEVLTQMVWTICLAIGCVVAMALSWFDVSLLWQIIWMSVASVAAFIWVVPVARRWHDASNRRQSRDDRTGMDAPLYRRAVVTEDIEPGRLGRVRIDGDSWQVMCPSEVCIPRGSEVVVTAYDSIVLRVQPVD